MSEQVWREFLAADGVDDRVVLHGGATAVFRVLSLGVAAQLVEAVAQVPGVQPPSVPRWAPHAHRRGQVGVYHNST